MKQLCFLFLLVFSQLISAQQDALAKQYFEDSEFEKALVLYERLSSQHPARSDYADQLVRCYQQLSRFEEAENFISNRINSGFVYPTLYIDLGNNHQLQQEQEEAEIWYQKALASIEENPNYSYGVGFRFQQYTLLDYALKAFRRGMELNPEQDFNFQIARIYGEQGNINGMFEAFMQILEQRKASTTNVMRNLSHFISADPQSENNQLLRKILLVRAQKTPDILWNELLSWLFVQQNQFNLALSQEKAIYKRSGSLNTDRLLELGTLSQQALDFRTASSIYNYVVNESTDAVTRLNAELELLEIEQSQPGYKAAEVRKKFENLLETHGLQSNTVQLQLAFAKFLAFTLNETDPAITLLKNSLELDLSRYAESYLKLALGDILVYVQRFNEALILYTQVQKRMKNDVLGQDARFRIARTSFYKGDFDWSLTQLKVLRNSTSQLIANDAMALSLTISDNSFEDSTQTALKKFAKADLLKYQQKSEEAIAVLKEILSQHKGEQIEDETFLMLGNLYEQVGNTEAAKEQYLRLIAFYPQSFLADDAHFALGKLFSLEPGQQTRAMEHFETIISNHQDSYFAHQARKRFRQLRGDPVN